ncbi:S66 family peptidase [Enterococcus sp. HY326]|uniref:S66 family peptidase n=1 Tax=Enterococcus sp. HY326 TaxID=2971265 RepID=UPI00223F08EC|nr:S66 peptidase family protein [Enterococcus sp. HY326]
MRKPQRLKQGDKIAIVSLSFGILGEPEATQRVAIATERLKQFGLEPVFMEHALKGIDFIQAHPEKRAVDLKAAFAEPSIKGVICAIGGEDTFRTVPFLLEDAEFKELVTNQPKIFCGYSDSTINHLMFYKLGLETFYGPSFLNDLGEETPEMLSYTKRYFKNFLADFPESKMIEPSPVWYQETDPKLIEQADSKGFELLQGAKSFSGKLLGGCLDSLADLITGANQAEEAVVNQTYQLFPELREWQGKILFIEIAAGQPNPQVFTEKLQVLKDFGLFQVIAGVIVGKSANEFFYEEYQASLKKIVANPKLPIVTNVNFGHCAPRCVLPYGLAVKVDTETQKISFLEETFQ